MLQALAFDKLYLIPGNYELKDPAVLSELKKDPRVEIWEKGKELMLSDGKKYCLCHEPLNGLGADKFYLFGHIHRLQLVKRNGINVGIDIHNFRPVAEQELVELRRCMEAYYDDNVFTERCG